MNPCVFTAVTDPDFAATNKENAPAVAWCQTHNRPASFCTSPTTIGQDTMTDAHEAKAREIAEWHGLRCLIPIKGQGLTCHEHTLCDCALEKLLAVVIRDCEREALERAAKVAEKIWLDAHDTDFDVGVNSAKRAIASSIRALAQEEPGSPDKVAGAT